MVTRTTVLLALYTLVLRTDGTLRWGTVIPYRTGSVVYDKLGTSFALENVQTATGPEPVVRGTTLSYIFNGRFRVILML